MNLAEQLKIVPVAHDIDLSSAATMACDSINVAGIHKAMFVCQYQSIGGANHDVVLYSGVTNAATTTAVEVRYAFGGAAQGTATAGSTVSCDVLGATASTVSTSTPAHAIRVAHATYSDHILVIEADMAAIANGHQWLTLQFEDTLTGATGNVVVMAILEPRYSGYRSATVLA
jgi:hypothetical protein